MIVLLRKRVGIRQRAGFAGYKREQIENGLNVAWTSKTGAVYHYRPANPNPPPARLQA